jgi:glucose/arabinose dehydrogenase
MRDANWPKWRQKAISVTADNKKGFPMRAAIRSISVLAAIGGVALMTACAPAAAPKPAQTVAASAAAAVATQVDTIATGLEFPWSIAFLPDGALLVTEREGKLRVIRDGKLDPKPVAGVPAVFAQGQGGLFEVALHPRFAENRQIYLTFAAGTEQANGTRLIRATFDGAALTNVETLFTFEPLKSGGAHFGGRLLFLPDDTLLLTLGDGYSERVKAQDLSTDFGKIVRLTLDGKPAPDNPFTDNSKARKEIYTYGHRNVQGIARDPVSGRIYAHEHGPRGGDEVNLIQPGKNYGWPVITYGVDYSGAVISPFKERAGMEQPLLYWDPSIAPSGMTFYSGDMFPQWKGDLLVSALAGAEVRRVDLDAQGNVVGQDKIIPEIAERVRHVAQAPDGSLYVLTDALDGRVLRVRAK